MESLALAIDLFLFTVFTTLLIVASIHEAKHGKKVEREELREVPILHLKKIA